MTIDEVIAGSGRCRLEACAPRICLRGIRLTLDLSTRDLSTQDLSTQDLSTQDLSTQDLSTQDPSAQDLSTQDSVCTGSVYTGARQHRRVYVLNDYRATWGTSASDCGVVPLDGALPKSSRESTKVLKLDALSPWIALPDSAPPLIP